MTRLALEPTQMDANMDEEEADGDKIVSPPKKRVKPSKLRGGEQGPDGLDLRTLELGGTGDCGSRSIAFQLAAINSKSSNLAENVMSKIAVLGKALRSQALFHLCEVDLEWQKHWAPDDAWTPLTEDGPAAKDLKTFATETLHRDNRWICHYGLMAVLAVKKVHIIIWQYKGDDSEPWSKIAVISPNDEKKKLPIIHLAKDGGHYMPLISDTMQKPDYSLLENSTTWSSKGIQGKSSGEKKHIFRAGGGESNKGGINGPTGMKLRTLELGGTGDCGWRSIAFLIAAINVNRDKLVNSVLPKIESLAKILKGQALHFLCEIDHDWKENWMPEDTWTALTEDGPPAQNLQDFINETLHRENRWICRYGFMAICETKKVNLVIWQYRGNDRESWTKIATFSPKETKQFPTIDLAKVGTHLMPLIPDELHVPGNDLRRNGRTWKPRRQQNMNKIADFRGGGNFEQRSTIGDVGNEISEENIEDVLKSPDPWTTPKKKSFYTPESVKTMQSFNIRDALRTPETPATPCSNMNKTENKNNYGLSLSKVCHWACPFCQCQCFISNPAKRTQDIRTHLDKFHARETKKTKERNIEKGISASGRHGLGIAVLLEPLQLRKMPKQKAKIICPFCKFGADVNPGSAALRKKTWKHHLKSCTKAPKDCNLKVLYAARMKQEGGICLGNGESHRKKMIQGIWRRADNKAIGLGHSPHRLMNSNGQACDVICKKCWRVASHSKTWNIACGGEKMQDRPRILPSVRLWKKFIKKYGKAKLFTDLELNTHQQEKIQDHAQEVEAGRFEEQGNQECKSGHEPVRLSFQRAWQAPT